MSETRFCGACGQSNSVDARFCGKCGAPLSPIAAAVSPPAALPPAPVAHPPAQNLGQNLAQNKTLSAASIDPQALAAHVAAIQAAQAPQVLPPAPVPVSALPARAQVAMHTMLGASLDPTSPVAPPVVSPVGPPVGPQANVLPSAPVVPASRPRAHYATMIDPPREQSSFDPSHREAPPPAHAAPPAEPSAPREEPGSKPAMKTMMGMAFPGLPLGAPQVAAPAPIAPLTPAHVVSAHVEIAPADPIEIATQLTPVVPEVDSIPPPERDPAPGPALEHMRPRDQIMKSMLGAPTSSAPPVEPPVEPARKAPMKTMLGMSFEGMLPPVAAPAAPIASPAIASPAAPPASGNASIDAVGPTLDAASAGLPAPILSPTPHADAGPTEVAPRPVEAPRKQLGPSNRTMLGVIAPPGMIAKAQAAAESRPESSPPAAYGAEAPAAYPPAAYAPAPVYTSAHAPDVGMSGDMSIAGMPSPRRRVNAALVVVLVLGLLLVVGAAAAFVIFGGGSGRTIVVTPSHAESGEVLRVEVPGIPDGYRARFAGTELPLSAARAEFPLSAASLHVGDNALTIDLIAPGGAVETHQVTLTLTYRVRADLGALAGTPPAIVVVVEALPGSTVVLDGQPLALDATGRATRSYPLEGMTPTAEGLVEHLAHYTITPPAAGAAPSAPVQGTLTTRVPLTTMHVDRPGDDAVTDRDAVEIAGAVLAGATLTIDGAPVTVLPEGRFLYSYPLPAPGEFTPRIVATAPNRAPAVRTLRVRRVADLSREAATFTFDRTLTYARLATAPTTFASQRVMFEGRVYNVDVHDGRGVLQMLVRDCPTGQRCPLWVSYAAAVDVTVESWVRIYGVVEGEQQFRSTSGEIRTVPSVNATFVLPARP